MMSKEPTTIYTIGHSNLRFDELVDLLSKNKIEMLVDVRSTPYSQYNNQFDREQISHKLPQNGIEYKYGGDFLGGRPNDPKCYKNEIVPDEDHADYLHLVDYPEVMKKEFFQRGINYLIKLAKERKLVVMCSEEDPSICHRHHLIGKYLVSQQIAVLHIRGDGKLVKDQIKRSFRIRED